MIAAEGFVVVTLAFHREGKTWVGVCQELGTSTYGRTLSLASAELEDMVLLHLNALEQEGEQERFFEKHGIQFYATKPTEVTVQQPLPIDDTFFQPRTFPISRPPTPVATSRELVGAR